MKMNKEVVMVKLSDIIPNRFQPRLTFDEEALYLLSPAMISYLLPKSLNING